VPLGHNFSGASLNDLERHSRSLMMLFIRTHLTFYSNTALTVQHHRCTVDWQQDASTSHVALDMSKHWPVLCVLQP